MGLDMFLVKKVEGAEIEIAYWRKANQIHNWFVLNCQNGVDDCRETKVSRKTLMKLLADCKEVLKEYNTKKSIEILPTKRGFFFGGTLYDKWYYKDIKDTVELIENLEKELREDEDIYYYSSW